MNCNLAVIDRVCNVPLTEGNRLTLLSCVCQGKGKLSLLSLFLFPLVSPFIFSAVYPFVFKIVTWAMRAEEIGSTAGPTNSELCFSCEVAVSTAHREESLLASRPQRDGRPEAARRQRQGRGSPGVVSGQGWEGAGQTEGEAAAIPRGSPEPPLEHAGARPWSCRALLAERGLVEVSLCASYMKRAEDEMVG